MHHITTPTDSQMHRMARSMAHHRRMHRALCTAGQLLFAVAVGVACTLLLLGYFTPCEAGSLCMAAVVTPTRTGPGQWLHALRRWAHRQHQALRARYLQARISAALIDLEHLQATADFIPLQQELHRQCIEAWRVQLIDCDLSTRNQ